LHVVSLDEAEHLGPCESAAADLIVERKRRTDDVIDVIGAAERRQHEIEGARHDHYAISGAPPRLQFLDPSTKKIMPYLVFKEVLADPRDCLAG